MKYTLRDFFPTCTASRRKVIVISTLIVMFVGLFVAGVIMIRRAKVRVDRLDTYGHMCQLKASLDGYEDEHGTLPPLNLRDNQGIPSQSWRALILPYTSLGISTQLNLSEPWNSDYNRKIINSVLPDDWRCFAKHSWNKKFPVSTYILAYVGRESIWDAKTGFPKGTTTEHPDAILLIWIPEGKFHPLQPGDITEEEVRERVEKGEEVLFIAAGDGYRYGIVTIVRGELTFPTWQQVLDRRESRN